ncbi:MAG: hypothetical protein QOI20_1728 [Acidimicrobiaceae bacterium]|jgi:uncharacterized membrane protein|nr:hypothetical protein [Acidimicrobiaceae bacterium]
MTTDRFARGVALLGAVFWLVFGVWAFVSPHSFFDTIATFKPYNKHFLHDAGAFQIGLGLALLLGLTRLNTLATVLTASAAASVFHELAHILDRDLGGKTTDPIGLGIVALLTIAAAAAAWPLTGPASSQPKPKP